MVEYGDVLMVKTPSGRQLSFRFVEFYDGGRGGPNVVAREMADYRGDVWPAQHSHDDIYYLYLDECEVIPKDDPRFAIGNDI